MRPGVTILVARRDVRFERLTRHAVTPVRARVLRVPHVTNGHRVPNPCLSEDGRRDRCHQETFLSEIRGSKLCTLSSEQSENPGHNRVAIMRLTRVLWQEKADAKFWRKYLV